jgi:hypothetical protein
VIILEQFGSEWEIILEQLIIMGYVVKQEVESEIDDQYIFCWIVSP